MNQESTLAELDKCNTPETTVVDLLPCGHAKIRRFVNPHSRCVMCGEQIRASKKHMHKCVRQVCIILVMVCSRGVLSMAEFLFGVVFRAVAYGMPLFCVSLKPDSDPTVLEPQTPHSLMPHYLI